MQMRGKIQAALNAEIVQVEDMQVGTHAATLCSPSVLECLLPAAACRFGPGVQNDMRHAARSSLRMA